ncbi:MAG: YitT family protein [Oscillospiraceae bacterium]|nr:YitT family protein [Oscillospiraceae bacterium]
MKRNLGLDLLLVVLGNALYAFGVAAFLLPGGLITGGTTGIALFVRHCFPISISAFVLGFNVVMLLLGLAVLGRKFAATTVLSSLLYPVLLELWERVLPAQAITQDVILCTAFGGMCIGAGLGIVIRTGASTGGMDIPPLVLNRLFHLPVGPMLYGFDMVILLLQALFSDWEQILYGILLVFIYTAVLNKVLVLGQQKVEVKVVSEKVEEIRRAVLSQVDRGGTLLQSRTGYMLRETEMLLSVVSPMELGKVEHLIHDIDPEAFLIVSRVSEVSGRGFTRAKRYLASAETGK